MIEHAPGAPGIPPTRTNSAKDMVGCALDMSRLWFTLGFGIVNKVYYRGSIYRKFAISASSSPTEMVPGPSSQAHRKLPDPAVGAGCPSCGGGTRARALHFAPAHCAVGPSHVLASECRLEGDAKLRPYALLTPHLGATGYGNRAAVVTCRCHQTLRAEQVPLGVALATVDERQRDVVGRGAPVMSAAVTVGRTFFKTAG